MIKSLEKSARTEDEAISLALAELGLDRDDVSVEIITRSKSGFLGIGACNARIKISYEVPDPKPEPVAKPEKKERTSAPRQEKKPAKKDGSAVAEKIIKPSENLHLDVRVDRTALTEGDTYDMAAVRIRILDDCGSVAPYAQLPVLLMVGGAAELVGPPVVTAEGGMCGCYIRTVGRTGEAKLIVSTDLTAPVELIFTVN